MSQVVPRETWGPEGPRNIAYLCDVFDPLAGDDPRSPEDVVYDDAVRWLKEAAAGLWPAMVAPRVWDNLHDPANRQGEARLETQYWRANTSGSAQYVTGAPRTTALRLDPHGTRFDNLFLAGDWVKTPLNAGCVEGAAMGGRIAAQRILEQAADRPLRHDEAVSAAAYVSRDGDLPLLQPVVMGGVSMHGYVFKASRDRLNETLRSAFEPLGITCKALLPVVLATSVQANEIRSAVRPDAGYMTEAELGFWVPVRMTWDGGSSVGFYLPYLFVDNVAALLAGREIYGFNKILGGFRYAAAGDVDPTVVEAQVLHTLAKDAKLTWLPVAALAKKATAEKSTLWRRPGDLITALTAELARDFTGANLGAAFLPSSFPMFFLKQLRAADDGAKADFQRAITAHVSIEEGSLSGGWLPAVSDDVQLTLTKHATLDIAGTLGLDHVASPRLGFWADFTATVGRGATFGGPGNGEKRRS